MQAMLQTSTSTLLLAGLADSNNSVIWEEFDTRYRPIVLGYARRLGLSEEEAADAAQDAMVRFVQEYRLGKYDRDRGRLRSWLIGIVKARAIDVLRAKARRREARGDSVLMVLPDDPELTAMWESERRRTLLRRALTELSESSRTADQTIRAFELFVLDEQPAADVATEMGITVQDVYQAKSRVADRLRGILTRLEQLYDDE